MLAICFDLDGVLIHSMPLHAQAWQQAGRRFGLRVSKRAIYACEGEPGAATARLLLRQRVPYPSATAVVELLREKERCFSQFASRLHVHPLGPGGGCWLHPGAGQLVAQTVSAGGGPDRRLRTGALR